MVQSAQGSLVDALVHLVVRCRLCYQIPALVNLRTLTHRHITKVIPQLRDPLSGNAVLGGVAITMQMCE